MFGNDPLRVGRDIKGNSKEQKEKYVKDGVLKRKFFLKREKQLGHSQREKRIETDLRSEMGAKRLDFSSQFHPH